MSQLSFYNDLFNSHNEATTSTASENVKVDHRFSITANVLKFIVSQDFYRDCDCDVLEIEMPREEFEGVAVSALRERGLEYTPYLSQGERIEYDYQLEEELHQYEQAFKAWLAAIDSERSQYVHAFDVEEFIEDVFYHYSIESRYYGVPALAHYEYKEICKNYLQENK